MTKNDWNRKLKLVSTVAVMLASFVDARFPMYSTVGQLHKYRIPHVHDHVHEDFSCTIHTYMYQVSYVPGNYQESYHLHLGINMVFLERIWELEKVENSVQNAGTSLSAENSTSQNRL